jgi:hypothetical protein
MLLSSREDEIKVVLTLRGFTIWECATGCIKCCWNDVEQLAK